MRYELIIFLYLLSFSTIADVFEYPVDIDHPQLKEKVSLLQKEAVYRSQFTHQKKIRILKYPLISKGYFIFSKQKGLYWKVESPLTSAFLMTQQHLIEIVYRQGKIVSKKEHPQMNQHFGKIFLSLFSGDLTQLQAHFTLYFQQQENQWNLGLIPKEALLKKVIHSIQMIGQTHINRLLIQEKSGDSSDYLFDFQSNAPLTPQEKALF